MVNRWACSWGLVTTSFVTESRFPLFGHDAPGAASFVAENRFPLFGTMLQAIAERAVARPPQSVAGRLVAGLTVCGLLKPGLDLA